MAVTRVCTRVSAAHGHAHPRVPSPAQVPVCTPARGCCCLHECARTHTRTLLCIHTRAHTCLCHTVLSAHLCGCTPTCAHLCAHTLVCTPVLTCVCMNTYVQLCTHTCAHTQSRVHARTCTPAHTHTDLLGDPCCHPRASAHSPLCTIFAHLLFLHSPPFAHPVFTPTLFLHDSSFSHIHNSCTLPVFVHNLSTPLLFAHPPLFAHPRVCNPSFPRPPCLHTHPICTLAPRVFIVNSYFHVQPMFQHKHIPC